MELKSLRHPIAIHMCSHCLVRAVEHQSKIEIGGHLYVFIPYHDQSGDRYIAYVEMDVDRYEALCSAARPERLDICEHFAILHVEPGENMYIEQANAIESYYQKLRLFQRNRVVVMQEQRAAC